MTEDLRPDFGSDEMEEVKAAQARQHLTNEYVEGSPSECSSSNGLWLLPTLTADRRCEQTTLLRSSLGFAPPTLPTSPAASSTPAPRPTATRSPNPSPSPRKCSRSLCVFSYPVFSCPSKKRLHRWKTKEGENWTHEEIGEIVDEMLSEETKPAIYDNHMAAARSRM